MSKSNDISNIAAPEDHRPLAADELDQIAGGTPSIPIPPPRGHHTLTHAVSGFFKNSGTHA
jgi:hypothetical protein